MAGRGAKMGGGPPDCGSTSHWAALAANHSAQPRLSPTYAYSISVGWM